MAGLETNGLDALDAGRTRRRAHGPFAQRQPIEKLFDRLPPHSLEAEMSLLGSMILDPKVTGDVVGLVASGDDFYLEAHAAIFDALITLYERHQSGDLVQLAQVLRDKNVFDGPSGVGGPEYLLKLAEQVPSAVNAPHYARIVADKARLRRLIDAAGQILHEAFHAGELGPDGAKEVIDRAEQQVFEIAQQRESADAERLSELLQQTMEMIEANEGRSVTGLATGYYDLDQMTSGLQAGEMIVIAARPSMGKTALALNLAEQIAFGGAAGPGGGHGPAAPVAVFSLEMSRHSVAQRLLCARSGVDSHLLRSNRLGEEHFRRLIHACGALAEAPIFIDDTPGLTILGLRARARRMVAQHGVKCVFIDYLQLMTAPGASRESRQVEVSAISRGVKALARELKIPVVCLSQLNRGAEQREGHRPRMSDLRESGSIEQDADVIALLHREEYYHQGDDQWLMDNPDKQGLAELIIAKQRNGPTGVVNMTWNSSITRFQNHSPQVAPPPAPRQAQQSPRPAPPSPTPDRPAGGQGSFGSGRQRTGPVDNHRDGGGPEVDHDFDAPF